MWYIYEKRIDQGYQKLYSHVPNAQIQKYRQYRQCIISASSVHYQRIISTSSAHHQRIISASSAHHQRIISASSAHHQRIINASSVYHCSVFIAELSPVYCCLVICMKSSIEKYNSGCKEVKRDSLEMQQEFNTTELDRTNVKRDYCIFNKLQNTRQGTFSGWNQF